MKPTPLIFSCVLACSSASLAQQPAVKDFQFDQGANATQERDDWKTLTQGEDLARGKAVKFSPQPNYHLTTDDNDVTDLTDGKLSARADDRLWFSKDAVGWYQLAATSGILMSVDLGSEQPIDQIAIRLLGGREQKTLDLPASVEFLASNDGQNYFTLQKQVKLAEGEKGLAALGTGYYFAETGQAFTAPVVCRTGVRARYVAIRALPVNSVFSDEISILKAKPETPLKELNSFPSTRVLTDGFAVTPRQNTLTVTQNIVTPNWFSLIDNSGLDATKAQLGFRLELPAGLRVAAGSAPDFKAVEAKTPDTVAYEFAYKGKNNDGSVGPVWIEKAPDANIPADAKVRLTGLMDGKDSHSLEFPLQIADVPATTPIKGLDISLAWMSDDVEQKWPNFLRDFRKMGFNNVSTFPRYFGKNADGSWNAAMSKNLAFLDQARAAGYGVVYNESPFHEMWKVVQTDLKAKAIDDAEATELFTQIDGKRGENMNILYRGRYYQNEVNRIAELAALVNPDEVFLDIEWWTPSVTESKKDPRVIAAWQQSGKSWDDFVTDIGTEVLSDIVTKMCAAVPQKKLIVGLYDSAPSYKIYNNVFQFDKIYPKIVDIAQPSLYVQGRAQLAAQRIRFDYDALQNRQLIPWLTAGTYGEFDPKMMEPMVLETVLNGSRGLTYFWFGDFDPMDFAYHSKALATIKPFETLIQNGKPIAYKGDNAQLHYTCFASDKEALLLVGNYESSPQTKTTVTPTFDAVKNVTLADGTPITMKGKTFNLEVPPGQFRLVHITRK